MPLSNFPHPSLNHFRIMAAQVCGFFEPLPITSQKMREVLFEEWEEDLLGARLQEQWGSAEEGRSVSGGGFADAVQALLTVIDERHHRMRQDRKRTSLNSSH